MAIGFNLVPADIRVPGQYIEIDNSKAYRGLSGIPTKVLVIGQKLASGTQAPLEPVLVTRADQAVKMFGKGSQLAHMMEKFLNANSYTPVYAIAQVDDGAAVAATGSITFAGPASAAGTLNLYIGGRRVRTLVTAAQTAAQVATALISAINANADLPVTAVIDGVNTAKVNITARNKGEVGNTLDLRFNYYQDQTLPAGLTAAIAAMAGGTGNPDVTDVIDAIGDDVWYTDFVMPYTDSSNLAAMEEELTDRFGPLKMIDGHLFTGHYASHADLVTYGLTKNSPHCTTMGGHKLPTPPYEFAAALAGISAYQMKIDPARPLQTLIVPGVLPPAPDDRFNMEERNILLYNGISTFRVDTGGNVVIERVVTNYRENSFGAIDPSYLDIETLKTLTYLRFDTRNFIALQYPRYKLADDGTRFGRGQNVVTPSVIRASLIARFRLWEEVGLVENIEQFKEDLIVERDVNDPNRINALIPPDIINQFRVFAGLVQYRL